MKPDVGAQRKKKIFYLCTLNALFVHLGISPDLYSALDTLNPHSTLLRENIDTVS